jgi:hypothetical protein
MLFLPYFSIGRTARDMERHYAEATHRASSQQSASWEVGGAGKAGWLRLATTGRCKPVPSRASRVAQAVRVVVMRAGLPQAIFSFEVRGMLPSMPSSIEPLWITKHNVIAIFSPALHDKNEAISQ